MLRAWGRALRVLIETAWREVIWLAGKVRRRGP